MSSSEARAVADLRRLGLVSNPTRDVAPVRAVLEGWAARHGVRLVDLDIDDPERGRRSSAEGVDLVVAAGGDGTVLAALRLTEQTRTPVLGVAFGHLGYLAETGVERLDRVLDELAVGRHTLLHLPGLETVLDGEEPAPDDFRPTALNDVVLSRVAGQGQAQLGVEVAGDAFTSFSTDALVVATPLGSTAYNLSAGGPLVAPGIDAVLITPVAPAGFYDRTLLVSGGDPITITVLAGSASVNVELDGRVGTVIHPGRSLTVRSLPNRSALVHLDATTFYGRVRQRLGITVAPVLGGSTPS